MTINPLSRACMTGNIEVVKTAVASGHRPDAQTLNLAIESRNVDIVKIVCNAGALPAQDTLSRACRTGQKAIVDFAVAAGANPSSDTLTASVTSGAYAIMFLMADLGARPDQHTLAASATLDPGTIDWICTLGCPHDDETFHTFCQRPDIKASSIHSILKAGVKPTAKGIAIVVKYYLDYFRSGRRSTVHELCYFDWAPLVAQSGMTFEQVSQHYLQRYQSTLTPLTVVDAMERGVADPRFCSLRFLRLLFAIGFKPTQSDLRDVQNRINLFNSRIAECNELIRKGRATNACVDDRDAYRCKAKDRQDLLKEITDLYFEKYGTRLCPIPSNNGGSNNRSSNNGGSNGDCIIA